MSGDNNGLRDSFKAFVVLYVCIFQKHAIILDHEVLVTEGIVDSLSQALLEGRPSGSLLLTPQQLQQLQRFQVAQEQAGGALTLTLQQGGSGVAPQLVLAPQGFLTAGGGSGQPTAEHILHTSQQIGHTSIQHVLQSSISHVRQASILQSSLQLPATHTTQVTNTGELRNCSDKAVGSPVTSVGTPTSPFSPRSLTPSPSPTQRVVTPQPPVLQLFHQQATTRNAVQNSVAAQAAIKAKQPPQILPKPPGSGGSLTASNTVTKSAQTVAPQQNQIPQQGTLLLNQVLPNGAVLVQQQTSSGVQLILKSPPPQSQGKPGLVLANGGIQPQAVIVQGRTQAHQVLRFVPSQVQLQQIQTSSGPTIIAVPSPAPPRTATPSQPSPLALAQKKIKKKKKKEDEPTRLDLANLIKISGIDEEDVSPVVVQGQASTQNKTTSTSPRPSTPKQQLQQAQIQQHAIQQQQQLQQQVQHNQLQSQIQKQINPSQLLAQLQTPAQVC
ncbi:polyhomeotic-like protein 3 [Cimex lectularius]|uniref:Uncharacterized protein n=1 Tax=Cimex lectularius TaxID=79782 RepID=A0A8I6THQ2_CIMLE|nr:polyhomeotic-like protein 3 [Cimex lectularius]